ncbi:MAG: tetratricopeptide repeat protein [Vulcanimicrobiota bacterium]
MVIKKRHHEEHETARFFYLKILILFSILITFLIPPSCACADTMPVAGGNNIIIISEKTRDKELYDKEFIENDIILEKEKLIVTMTEKEAKIEATFWLKNTAAREQWRMLAFPCFGGVGTGIVISPSAFTVTSQGRNIAWKSIERRKDLPWTKYGETKLWSMTFPAGKTVPITIKYSQNLFRDYLYGSVAMREFYYVLKSGACWKDKINDFELVVKWNSLEEWQRLCVYNRDLWPESFPQANEYTSPDIDWTKGEFSVKRRDLEPGYDYISFKILVKPGTPNLFAYNDRLLDNFLSGKYDNNGHPVYIEGKWVIIGNAYYDKGDVEKALYYYRKAIKMNHNDSGYRMEAWLGMALIYEHQHEYRKAMECFKKCAEFYVNALSRKQHFMTSEPPLLYGAARKGIKRMEPHLHYFYE